MNTKDYFNNEHFYSDSDVDSYGHKNESSSSSSSDSDRQRRGRRPYRKEKRPYNDNESPVAFLLRLQKSRAPSPSPSTARCYISPRCSPPRPRRNSVDVVPSLKRRKRPHVTKRKHATSTSPTRDTSDYTPDDTCGSRWDIIVEKTSGRKHTSAGGVSVIPPPVPPRRTFFSRPSTVHCDYLNKKTDAWQHKHWTKYTDSQKPNTSSNFSRENFNDYTIFQHVNPVIKQPLLPVTAEITHGSTFTPYGIQYIPYFIFSPPCSPLSSNNTEPYQDTRPSAPPSEVLLDCDNRVHFTGSVPNLFDVYPKRTTYEREVNTPVSFRNSDPNILETSESTPKSLYEQQAPYYIPYHQYKQIESLCRLSTGNSISIQSPPLYASAKSGSQNNLYTQQNSISSEMITSFSALKPIPSPTSVPKFNNYPSQSSTYYPPSPDMFRRASMPVLYNTSTYFDKGQTVENEKKPELNPIFERFQKSFLQQSSIIRSCEDLSSDKQASTFQSPSVSPIQLFTKPPLSPTSKTCSRATVFCDNPAYTAPNKPTMLPVLREDPVSDEIHELNSDQTKVLLTPSRNTTNQEASETNPDQDGKVYRLESEKESLQLQVSVLTEQIEAQTDKISELEKMLAEKKQLLGNTEESLQREMLSRSSLETQKLELMSAMSELKLQQAALERENIELRTSHYNNNSLGNHIQQPNIRKPLLSRTSPVPQHTSTPVHSSQLTGNITSPSSNCIVSSTTLGGASPIRTDGAQTNHEILQPRTPPASFRRTVDIRYGSLPRQAFPTNGRIDSNANQQQQSATLGPKKGVVFGRGFTTLLGGGKIRGQSVPNLADADKTIEDNIDSTSYSPQQSPLLQINKNKGIKKIFSKMKRSGSGNLEDLPGEGEFRRGGVRATAGARLGWSETQDVIRPEKPFDEWDTNNIVDWLQDLGLDMYIIEVKRWIKNGAQLRLAPVHDLEKELGIKNALHRKKIQLAILEFTDENASDSLLSAAGKLDTSWVLRWLDDTGLPQHKDAFSLGRVDGRMLHRLTIDDLAALHVTSLLHANSLRRGIQVLREHSFDPDCLIRRSTPGESDKLEPEKVKLWTAHRVMEWLREVDLAEYAPNLRGAGVHGSLMVYEPKFTAELLATLLNISPSKTLLRRHLSTHFKELLGREVIQEKREAEAILGYVPLTPAAKLKIAKKSQFSLKRKKSKGEPDYGDLVCPLGSSSGAANTIIQSGELTKANIGSTSHGDASGTMKTADGRVVGVCHLIDDPALTDEVFHSVGGGTSPTPTRIKDSMLV